MATSAAVALAHPARGSRNRLLDSLTPGERARLERLGDVVLLDRNDVLFEAGENVAWSHFPTRGLVASLAVLLADGRTVEVASIGWEGAVGGIVSNGNNPAFARAVVQTAGTALRVPTAALEELKASAPSVHNLFSRYADFLLAQVMQSVACNSFHALDARCCRWLLTMQDRVGGDDIPLTQEALAEMLGVQRTTITAVARELQERGLIRYRRGRIQLCDRTAVERAACECYANVERHFHAVLPELDMAPGGLVIGLER